MRLYLLRHGEVTSHEGDIPITPAGERQAFHFGRVLGLRDPSPILVLSGETRRTVDTAAHLARGIVDGGGQVIGPRVAFALRNPDLYLAGARVNMVSSAETLVDQVDGMSAEDIAGHGFYPEFFASSDRIGWWLTHDSPPGETAAEVAVRIRAFALSLTDPIPGNPSVVVAVTHSPLLRATGLDLFGRDPGEPPWVGGLTMQVEPDGRISIDIVGGEPT